MDKLDYLIAETLGLTLAQVRQLPSGECEEWRDWLVYKAWEEKPL